MRRSSQLLLNGPVKVYQVNKPVIPFSFGNAIFLNQHLHDEEELKEIIRHEFIHVKQRHTIDIIWSEAICILNWYNPFSWLLRKAIRQNLEFIADQQVLKTGLDRRQYQYLLLKVIGVPTYSIASNFNFKSLKKRIAMMNKVSSARVHLVRFLLLLPLVAVILLAFRNAAKQKQVSPVEITISDTTPVKKYWPENVESFHSVNNQVTVTLKNGNVEKYNLNNDKELASFEKKYGKMPEPPTPPAAPQVILEMPLAPDAPVATMETAEMPVEPMLVPAPPSPETPPFLDEHYGMEYVPFGDDCYNDKGYCMKVVETPKGRLVIVMHKSRREAELVYLDDWKKDNKFEKKYGKLTPQPALHELPAPITEVPAPKEVVLFKDVDDVLDGELENKLEKLQIIAKITEKTSPKDFEKLKADLRLKGITLELLDTKYKDGKLVAFDAWFKEGESKLRYVDDRFNSIIISRTAGKDGKAQFHIPPIRHPEQHQ